MSATTADPQIKSIVDYENEIADLKAQLKAAGVQPGHIYFVPLEATYPKSVDPESPGARATNREVGSVLSPWAHHEAISCIEDPGYGLDSLRARAVAAVHNAFNPQRVGGKDRFGRDDFSKLPPFKPTNKVHVQVWIEEGPEVGD